MTRFNIFRPSIAECVTLACAWEVLAPKPGNVRPGDPFEDAAVVDFVTSGILTGSILQHADVRPLGELILECIETRARWISTNTNLGLVLLLAPLAQAAASTDLPIDRAAVQQVLNRLGPRDAEDVYRAIRAAEPGGLGTSDQWDVAQPAPQDLLAAMKFAAPRDSIAAEYSEGFPRVFSFVVPRLQHALSSGMSLRDTIVHVFLETLAEYPDSLIVRKCGPAIGAEASQQASQTLRAWSTGDKLSELVELDRWLRADGNRRNPGTTADFVGAGLFVALRNGVIRPPLVW